MILAMVLLWCLDATEGTLLDLDTGLKCGKLNILALKFCVVVIGVLSMVYKAIQIYVLKASIG